MKRIGVAFLEKRSQSGKKDTVVIVMWDNAFLKRTDGIIRGLCPCWIVQETLSFNVLFKH